MDSVKGFNVEISNDFLCSLYQGIADSNAHPFPSIGCQTPTSGGECVAAQMPQSESPDERRGNFDRRYI